MSLCGCRITNLVKIDKNTILFNGTRDATPLKANNIVTKAAMDKFFMRQD